MVENLPIKLKPNDTILDPQSWCLFSVGYSEELSKEKYQEFHTIFAKILFACNRSCPDLHPAIAELFKHVNNNNED